MKRSYRNSREPVKVIVFGCFDPLHDGHINFFQQAKKLGDHLTVVVARDSSIVKIKNRAPRHQEVHRMKSVQAVSFINEVILGEAIDNKDPYHLLSRLDFHIVALGYDQQPDKKKIQQELSKHGKQNAQVIRLKPFHPEKFKSSLF